MTDLYPGLGQIELHGQCLSHEDVRIVAVVESPFQLFHLPPGEVRPCPASLLTVRLAVAVVIIIITTVIRFVHHVTSAQHLCSKSYMQHPLNLIKTIT